MPLRVARCRASRCPLATASQQAVRPSSYMWHTYHIHMAHGTSPPRPGERELTHNDMTLFCTPPHTATVTATLLAARTRRGTAFAASMARWLLPMFCCRTRSFPAAAAKRVSICKTRTNNHPRIMTRTRCGNQVLQRLGAVGGSCGWYSEYLLHALNMASGRDPRPLFFSSQLVAPS